MPRRLQFEWLEPRALLDAASVAGNVFVAEPAGHTPLAGVTIELLDETGQVLGTAETNAAGSYRFDNLPAGYYGLQQLQPVGLDNGIAKIGSGGGSALHPNLIIDISVTADTQLSGYNFVDRPAATDPNANVPHDDRAVFTTAGFSTELPPIGFVAGRAVTSADVLQPRASAQTTPPSVLLVFATIADAPPVLGDDSGGSGRLFEELTPTLKPRTDDPLDELWESLQADWAEIVQAEQEAADEEAVAMVAEADTEEETARARAFEIAELEDFAAVTEEVGEVQVAPPPRLAERIQ